MIGLAIPDLRRPYFAELAHAFARTAEAHGGSRKTLIVALARKLLITWWTMLQEAA